MQLNADMYLLVNYSTCFGRSSYPSSGVHKTVVVASGIDHTIWEASFFKRDQIRTGLVTFEEAREYWNFKGLLSYHFKGGMHLITTTFIQIYSLIFLKLFGMAL